MGLTPGQASPFLPYKYNLKDLYIIPSFIWLDFCMLARTLKNNLEMQNLAKNFGGNPW